MKIQPAHYAFMKAAIGAFTSEDVASRRQAIVAEGKAKDVATRLRWDLSYAANLTPFICKHVYPYADDSHVDTALRQIMRECFAS
jgi:hypothetical protein